MAFNVSQLDAWVSNNNKKLVVGLFDQATTLKELINGQNAQVNNKPGDSAIVFLNSEANLQKRISGCGRQLKGNQALTDKTMKTVGITDQELYCTSTLWGTYAVWALRNGMDPETEGWDADFAQQIIDGKLAVVSEAVEQLIWQGDTALDPADNDYDANLVIMDGLLKKLQAGAGVVNITNAQTNVVDKLTASFLLMPTKVTRANDFKIFVGEDMYNQYVIEMVNKNIYNPTAPNLLFGTQAVLVPTAGLTGTGKYVMARVSDLIISTDLVSDFDFVKFTYSTEQLGYYMDMFFALGVELGRNDYIGYNKTP